MKYLTNHKYCDECVKSLYEYAHSRLLLFVTDMAIIDFLMGELRSVSGIQCTRFIPGNDDRNTLFHLNVWHSMNIYDTPPLLLDNGKGWAGHDT